MRAAMKKLFVTVMAVVIAGTASTVATPTKVEAATTPKITYQAHVQCNGWMGSVANGKTAGTTGYNLRVDAIRLQLSGAKNSNVKYRTYMQNTGWKSWNSNNRKSGTIGQSLRAEAIQIKLTGKISKKYDVYYRTHVQNQGWNTWKKNGQTAGTTNIGVRMEAFQVQLVKKGSKPKNTDVTGQTPTKLPTTFGEEVAKYACQFIGTPYRWGGTSLTNGADCSGFVMSVYAHFGYGLPHSSVGQRSVGYGVGITDRKPGDIICYSQMGGNSHVGIYIGNDKVVNAGSAKTGICIRQYNYRPICNIRRMK